MNGGPMGRTIAVLLLAGLVAGCATPTPYRPVSDGEGYAEQSLEADRYRITFRGNSLTPRETVEDYLLFRAAEVTLERGYDHFVVVDRDIERSTTYHSDISGFGSRFGVGVSDQGRYFGAGYGPFGGDGTAISWPSDSYTGYANIVMRHGGKPPEEALAYDARAVVSRIGPTIVREPAS